jgi:alginate O-acetyltransferase complex protein AlgI
LEIVSYCVLLVILGTLTRRRTLRQLLLLAASYVFYATFGLGFLAVLVASSLVNFACGIFLQRKPTLTRLWLSVSANILLLGFFKTTHALASIAGSTSPLGHFLNGIAMPIGISFWTFQALSYLFDVYRQEELDPSLLEFSLYLAFAPTVLMGPICRLGDMLPQFRAAGRFSQSNLLLGTSRIVTGLFMKFVLSQLLLGGLTTDTGVATGFSENVTSGLDVWFLAVGFGFQLFFDFAGYSHMALGVARIFGFELAENFNAPFISYSPSEFWNRWHMSLSLWIRDYVFLPFAALRREIWWRYFALLVAMTLFGLWHGVKTTFVLWGIYHGILLVAHRMIQQVRRSARQFNLPPFVDGPLSWVVSFFAISLGWILFRSNDLGQALSMLRVVLNLRSYLSPSLASSYYVLVIATLIAYLAYHTLYNPTIQRLLSGLTPDLRATLASWGLTPNFARFVWLIPMIAILFLGMLAVGTGSEGTSGFVYAVF